MVGYQNSTSCVAENALKQFRFVGSSSMASSDNTVANVNGGEPGSLNGEPVVKRPRESGSQVSSLRVPKEPQNKVTVVLGAQWGDEGKGKVVDLLAMDADIVCRCQVLHNAAGFTSKFTELRLCFIWPPCACNSYGCSIRRMLDVTLTSTTGKDFPDVEPLTDARINLSLGVCLLLDKCSLTGTTTLSYQQAATLCKDVASCCYTAAGSPAAIQ